ncbi:MAG: small basic family protein [Bacillota bacterium]
MWLGISLTAVALIAGVIIGLNVPLFIPQIYGKYLGIAILAAIDSVFGGVRAGMEERFDNAIFVSGFVSNTLLAAGLVFIGDRLGVELYTAAVVAFGVRLFQNLAAIRRKLIKK